MSGIFLQQIILSSYTKQELSWHSHLSCTIKEGLELTLPSIPSILINSETY